MDHSAMDHDHSTMTMLHEHAGVCNSKSGMNMIMFMDGFHSIIFRGSASPYCINLFFSSWTLDSRLKVILGMIGLFLMAIGAEGLSVVRKKTRKKSRIVALHALQAFTGYLLMLGGMTFVIELLFSICLGLATGYYIFHTRR